MTGNVQMHVMNSSPGLKNCSVCVSSSNYSWFHVSTNQPSLLSYICFNQWRGLWTVLPPYHSVCPPCQLCECNYV